MTPKSELSARILVFVTLWQPLREVFEALRRFRNIALNFDQSIETCNQILSSRLPNLSLSYEFASAKYSKIDIKIALHRWNIVTTDFL